MRVFCHKLTSTQVVFCISHCFPKPLKNILCYCCMGSITPTWCYLWKMLPWEYLLHQVLFFLNYRAFKQSCSLPVLITLLWGQTDGWHVVPAEAAPRPPSTWSRWPEFLPAPARLLFGEQFHLLPLWRLLALVEPESKRNHPTSTLAAREG